MSDDYGAINGEQINFYAIDDGNASTDLEALHSFAFNQTIDPHRGRQMRGNHNFVFDQSLQLRSKVGMVSAEVVAFDQNVDVFQLYPIVIRHVFAFGLTGDIEHLAFNRWRTRERLVVQDDFRGMQVAVEPRRIEVLPDPVPPPRHMRAVPDNRRIIVQPQRGITVRQKLRVIPA